MEREEKIVQIAGQEIRIRELTTEDESKIRAQSQVWNQKKKMPEVDQARLDANMILYSVVRETWPSQWGELTLENIQQLPTKYTRKLLFECQRLNILDSDVSDFLGSQSKSESPKALG